MIIGLGNDLCDIRRIEKSLGRFGDRFVQRVFTDDERLWCDSKKHPAWSYAKRFAAKEAAAKALGTGFAEGVYWQDLAVTRNDLGRPAMTMTGGALARLKTLVPEGFRAQVSLTMTDEYPMAQAVCIIEALPLSWPDLSSLA